LKISNDICIDNQIKLKPEFKQLTNSLSHFKICEIDFADPIKTMKSVNHWVNEKTHHLISDILQLSKFKT
jgi:serine protease inhibitor